MSLFLFLPFLGGVMAAGSTGMLFPTGDWYRGLNKPVWTPPNWVFPIAWTLLYIAIAIAGWRAAGIDHGLSTMAIAFWGLQIVLNCLWTPVVFGAHRLFAGVVVIAALWLSILVTTVLMFQVDSISGLLFLPYLVWVSYATALNISLWRLNPDS